MEMFKEMKRVTSCWCGFGLFQIILNLTVADTLYVETQSDWYSAMQGCSLQERQLGIARSRNLTEFSAAVRSSVGAWVGGKRVYSPWKWNDNIPLYTHYGCFSDSAVTPWMNAATQTTTQYVYQCLSTCATFSVALKLNVCRCLTGVPEVSQRLSDHSCRSPCFGSLVEMCGGVATYSIYQRDRLPYILGDFPWGLARASETSKCGYIVMVDYSVKTYTFFFDECGEKPQRQKRMMCQTCNDTNSQNCSVLKWYGTTTYQGAKNFCETMEMNLTTAASGTLMFSFTLAVKPFWVGLRLDIVLSWVNGAAIQSGDHDTPVQYVDGNCVAVVSDQSGFQKLQLENCAKSKPYFCDLDVPSSEISTESTEFVESTATSTDITLTATERIESVVSTATSTYITSTESIESVVSTATSTYITSTESTESVVSTITSTDITSTESTESVVSTTTSTDITLTATESIESVVSTATSTYITSTESIESVVSTTTSTDITLTATESTESVGSTATSTYITSTESIESVVSTTTSTDIVNHTLTTQFLGYTFTTELTEQIQSISQIDGNILSSQIIIYTPITQLNEYTLSSQLTDTSISPFISQFYTFETMSFHLIDSETYSAQIPTNETSSSQFTEFETSSSQLIELGIQSSELYTFLTSSSGLLEFITSSSGLSELITSSSDFIIEFGTSSSEFTVLETSSSEFERSSSDLVEFETSGYQITEATEKINPTTTFSETIYATPSTSVPVLPSTLSLSRLSLAMTTTALFLVASSELQTDRNTLSSSSSSTTAAAADETTLETAPFIVSQTSEINTLEITWTTQSIENEIASVLPTTINSVQQPTNSNVGQSESKYTTQSWTLASGNPIPGSTSHSSGSTTTRPSPLPSTNSHTGVDTSDVSKSDLLPIYIVLGVCLALLVVLTGVTVTLFKHLRHGNTSSDSSWRRSSLTSASSSKELVSFKPESRLRAHLESERL